MSAWERSAGWVGWASLGHPSSELGCSHLKSRQRALCPVCWDSASVWGLCWPLRAGCPVFANPFSVTNHEHPRAGTLPPQLTSPAPWPVTSLGTSVSLLLTLTSNLVSTGSPAGRQLVVSLRSHRGSRRSVYQLFPAPGHSRGGWTTGLVTFTV